jgi:DNA-directed RNA polymerase beta subunit
VNVMPGKGVSHRYFFEPETSIFKINVGQSKVALLPVLKAMGVPEREIRKAWGNDIYAINAQHDSPHIIDKLYQRMVRRADPNAPYETKAQGLANELKKMELDPEVTKRTLGAPHQNLTAEAILATTKKLLAVNKRETDADDRDHLAFQHLMGPEDLIAERIGKDRMTLNKLLWTAGFRGNLEHIQPGAFTKSVMAAFMSSGLGQAAEEVNAAELVDHQGRITRLGEGGIGEAQAVPEESRNVHPSQMAFVDPVKTPECYVLDGVNTPYVMTREGWKKWADVTEEDEFACLIDDRLEYHRATAIHTSRYVGPIMKGDTRSIGYEVTPNHRMWVQPYHSPKAAWRFETAEKTHDRYMRFQIGGHGAYIGESENLTQIELVGIPKDYPVKVRDPREYQTVYLDINDWAELVGWYFAEGCIQVGKTGRGEHYKGIGISQHKDVNPENFTQIEQLLKRLPFRFSIKGGTGFDVNDTRLGEYFIKFGRYCYEKQLPEDVFEYPIEARRKLYEALLLGDGRHDRKGRLYAYCTTSKILADQFVRLAFGLGQSSSLSIEPEKRSRKDGTANYDNYVVQLHKETTRTIENNTRALQINQPIRYTSYHYDGQVRCATVPGGLLYCRINGKGGFWSGNSFKAGVDLRTAFGVQKGTDGRMYAPFRDPNNNRIVYRSPQELADLTVAFPGELETGRPMVSAMSKGKLRFVPRSQVDLVLPTMENAFSPLSNMVPMKSAVKGQRVSMGARMLSQALPLMNSEAPLVQSAAPIAGHTGEKISFEQLYGQHMGPIRADKDGVVTSITNNGITVKHTDGTKKTYELYDHHPYNRKTYLHNTPLVKEGDRIKADDFLAKSNYTDHEGTAALGINARVGYLPFRGLTYEDAAVISESMAKRMTSEHMYQHPVEFGEGTHKGKRAFVSLFPSEYDRNTLDQMDDHGVIKPGTIVKNGTPLALIAKEKERAYNQVHRSGKSAFSNNSITWDHNADGLVTDVVHTRNGALIAVKAYMPMQVGDKLAGRYGDKSVIADIVPDEQMPQNQEKKPFEILVSPMGLISRINSAQAVETALGKIAEKTGQPYKVDDFNPSVNLTRFAMNELQKHGMTDTETVTDPLTGRQIPNVLAGHRFFMKLHHTSECFDADTEALTLRGWIPWPDVRHDDLLATIDNNRLVYEKPIRVIHSQYAGELYCFEGRYLDYAVTGNHRLFGHYYHRKDKTNQFELASKVHGRRFCIPQFGFVPDEQEIPSAIRIGKFELDWGDFAELSAWWVTEGYAKVTNRRSCVVIYQSRVANPDHFARLEWLASRLPFNWHYYRKHGLDEGIIISSRDLAIYFRQFGTHSYNKRLPRDVLNAPPYARRRALETMLNGDGSRNQTKTGPSYRYTTTSRGLADDFQELCIRSGLGTTVRAAKPRELMVIKIPGRNVYTSKCRPVWECGVALSRTIAQIDGDRNKSGFSKKQYNGMVYCAEMRTGLLYVRRNGKPMLSGNSKGQGRGAGGGYTAEGTPSKGGETGSKRISLMDTNALLAHGATDVLKDAHTVRGQRNEEYWLAFMSGRTPPEPKVPFIYDKFLNELKASGINVIREGKKLHIMPLIDRDIEQLSEGRELKNAKTVDWKEGLKPIRGGLFDPGITGGHAGNRWAKIPLHESMPNPVMEEPIRRLLGLTEANFLDILSGRKDLNGLKGPQAISGALSGLDLNKEIGRAKAEIASGKKSYRDAAVRRLQYLESAQRMGLHPKDWIVNSVPVLPPTFRPVSVMQGKRGQLISDPNYLYREVWDANENLKGLKGLTDDISEERLNLYNAFKGVTGLGDPIKPKNVERGVKGVLRHIFGSSPKFGTVQFKLLGASVNLVGRGVIVPNPDMDMDSIGLPEHRAWEVYKPFIIRGLVRSGMPGMAAIKAVEDKSKPAKDVMLKVMQERPVLVNRYPVLHRYGLMAFWPKLVHGETIQVSPIITKGFAADFDGDTMQYHVPASEDARKDAIAKMLPSSNLYSGATFKALYVPNQEFVQGLHAASFLKDDGRPRRTFATRRDALNAYKRGEINLGTPIEVLH